MFSQLSDRVRTFIWIGAAVLGLTAAYLMGWEPLYADYRAKLNRIELLQSDLDRAHRRLADVTELDRTFREQQGRLEALEKRMFTGDRPSLVGAEMQNILSDICKQQEVSIRKTRMLKEGTIGKYTEVKVKIELNASLTSLAHLLYDLFNNDYLFLVDEFEASSAGRGGSYIRVDMTVSGLMKAV
ncbi:MAG: type II secretion system protein M [Deltaproteobacteria bacterium]|nr:type II secretion system protein M [Deltaproteobacteria bacterium]